MRLTGSDLSPDVFDTRMDPTDVMGRHSVASLLWPNSADTVQVADALAIHGDLGC